MAGSAINPFLEIAAGSSTYEFTLNAGVNAGDTALTLDRAIGPIYTSSTAIAIIDAFTSECELRLFSVSGSTMTVSALDFDHSAGAAIHVTTQDSISTYYFGCLGDSSTDDWRGLQNGLFQTGKLGVWLNGMTRRHECSQPLIGSEPHLRDITIRCATGFSPVDADPAAMVMNCQDTPQTFTCSASDNTFTTPGNHNIGGTGNMICFNAPNGETLPTPIVAGRIYFVKTLATTSTFTVSTTNGGGELDITVDGTGVCYPDLLSTSRIFFENVTLQVNSHGVTGLNGLSVCCQQPTYTNKLRVEVGTGIGVNLYLSQISMHHNMEVVQGGAGTGLLLTGSGHTLMGLNVVGSGTLVDDQAVGTEIHGLWMEQQVTGLVAGIKPGVGAIYDIQTWAPNEVGPVMILNASIDNSFSIRGPRVSGSTYVLLSDTARSITLVGSDFPTQGVLHLVQEKGANSGPGPLYGSAALDFGSVSAGTTSELTITVNGAIMGHKVVVTPDTTLESGLVWDSYVSAADTVTVRVANVTGSPIDPANRTWYVTLLP